MLENNEENCRKSPSRKISRQSKTKEAKVLQGKFSNETDPRYLALFYSGFCYLHKATVALCLQESCTVRLTVLVSKSFQKTYLRRFVRDQKIKDHNKTWRLLEFSTDEDAEPICIRRYAYQPTQQEMETEESEPAKEKKVTRTRKASKSDPVVEENFSDEEDE